MQADIAQALYVRGDDGEYHCIASALELKINKSSVQLQSLLTARLINFKRKQADAPL